MRRANRAPGTAALLVSTAIALLTTAIGSLASATTPRSCGWSIVFRSAVTAFLICGHSAAATPGVMLPAVVRGRLILVKRQETQRKPDSAAVRARSPSIMFRADAVVVVDAAYIPSARMLAIERKSMA